MFWGDTVYKQFRAAKNAACAMQREIVQSINDIRQSCATSASSRESLLKPRLKAREGEVC